MSGRYKDMMLAQILVDVVGASVDRYLPEDNPKLGPGELFERVHEIEEMDSAMRAPLIALLCETIGLSALKIHLLESELGRQ